MLYSNLGGLYTEIRVRSFVLKFKKQSMSILDVYASYGLIWKTDLKILPLYEQLPHYGLAYFKYRAQVQSHCPLWYFYGVKSWNCLTFYRLLASTGHHK